MDKHYVSHFTNISDFFYCNLHHNMDNNEPQAAQSVFPPL